MSLGREELEDLHCPLCGDGLVLEGNLPCDVHCAKGHYRGFRIRPLAPAMVYQQAANEYAMPNEGCVAAVALLLSGAILFLLWWAGFRP